MNSTKELLVPFSGTSLVKSVVKRRPMAIIEIARTKVFASDVTHESWEHLPPEPI